MPVRKRNVAMVYQQFINYPTLTRLREHRLAAARARHGRGRDRRASAQGRRAAAARRPISSARRWSSPAASSSAPRSPARSSRSADLVLLDEPLANLDYKLREELREELPQHLRRVRRDLRLCHDRAAARRCCSAATRRRCGEGRVTSSARPLESIAARSRPRHRAGLLRSADEHDRRHRARRRLRCSCRRQSRCRRRRCSAGCRRRATRVGFRAQPSRARRARRRAPSPAGARSIGHRDHRLGELRPRRLRRRIAGSCWRPACTSSSRVPRSTLYLDPRRLFVFDRGRRGRRRRAGRR